MMVLKVDIRPLIAAWLYTVVNIYECIRDIVINLRITIFNLNLRKISANLSNKVQTWPEIEGDSENNQNIGSDNTGGD